MNDITQRERVKVELLRQALNLAPLALAATLVNSFIVLLVLWGPVPHKPLIIWFSASWIVAVLRAGFLRKYRSGLLPSVPSEKVTNCLISGLLASGLVWGSLGIFLFPVDSPTHQMLIVFVLCGMVAGATETFSPILYAFAAFALPALIPLCIRFLIIGGPVYCAMSAMTALYIILTMMIAKRINTTNTKVIELKEHVAHIAEELNISNSQLQEEIAQRRQAEYTLRSSSEQLRLMSSRLLSTQEDERKRIARDLHDTIGQTFAALKLRMEMMMRADAIDSKIMMPQMEDFVQILQQSIEETRKICRGLRPAMLDNLGIIATLGWLCREFQGPASKLHIEFEPAIDEREIPEPLKIVIFRIAQEALSNIVRHSKAEWVDISLSKNGDQIGLVVSDDGLGMDVNQILRNGTTESLGLTGMKERAELTGGKFSIESAPGKGATIRAYWPV
jgi:signal transduction histidine kinase